MLLTDVQCKTITKNTFMSKELDSTRYIPTTESNQEDAMQAYRTRQRLLNNEISKLKN